MTREQGPRICTFCGKRTHATTKVCMICKSLTRQTRHSPSDALRGGQWVVDRKGISRWVTFKAYQ